MCRRFKFTPNDEAKHLEVYKDLKINSSFDVIPGRKAYGIINFKNEYKTSLMTFGYLGFDQKLIYNARSETVMLKDMFKDDFERQKIVIPCTSFFEEDRKGIEHEFIENNNSILYLAGFYNHDNRFVILTEEPVEEIKRYHPRMPLLITKENVENYLSSRSSLLETLIQERPSIHQKGEWIQLSLF